MKGERLIFPGLEAGFCVPGNQPEIDREREKERKKDRHGDQSSDGAKVF